METYVQNVRENCGVKRMSDDLMSRKSLIENLNKFAPEYYNALINNLITKEPTAFDREKVIEELQEAGQSCNEANDNCGEEAIEYAIEIVEKGGIE